MEIEKNNKEIIIDRLSIVIQSEMKVVANEERYPQSDPDKMDQIINDGRTRIIRLREIRNELEEIFTNILPLK